MKEEQPVSATFIPSYAGHADVTARRLSDQQVRATVGEMLTDLGERLSLQDVRDRYDAVLLRCEFGDQHVILAVEEERFGRPELAELVENADRALIGVANRGPSVTAAELPAFLDDLKAAFDQRAAAIAGKLKR
jgi:hypothetical protein